MKAMKRTLRPTRMAVIIATAGLLPLGVYAQGTSSTDLQARYKEDIQRCETLTDPERKRTCRREAGAALQEARRNRLVTGAADPSTNATARCQRLPTAQRADCERLMTDSGAVQHGSVSGGGVIREMTITVPADTTTGTYGQPATGSYTGQTAPVQGGYGSQPAAGSTYSQPAPSGTYTQPSTGGTYAPAAPAQGSYGSQPATGGTHNQAAPSGGYQTTPGAPGSYGTQPTR